MINFINKQVTKTFLTKNVHHCTACYRKENELCEKENKLREKDEQRMYVDMKTVPIAVYELVTVEKNRNHYNTVCNRCSKLDVEQCEKCKNRSEKLRKESKERYEKVMKSKLGIFLDTKYDLNFTFPEYQYHACQSCFDKSGIDKTIFNYNANGFVYYSK